MIRAVVWKELREQGLIAAMLAVLGGALLIAAAAFADPPVASAAATDIVRSLGVGRLLALMLVVTAGMVCGGALFAAEKEAGTMAFLDTLPTARAALWRAKVIAGLVLAAVVVGALLGTTAALQLGDGPFLRRLVIYAVLAYAWGALGSTLARTTLGSVGVAIPAATVAAFAFLLPITLFMAAPGAGVPRSSGWTLFAVLMVVVPLALSAWRFTSPDRARAADALSDINIPVVVQSGQPIAEPNQAAGLGLRAVAWLTFRQMRVAGLVLSAFALAFGCSMLLPDMRPLFFWPPLALAAGVFAGLTAFGDEQSHRTAGFWGEHRLPIGRAWCVKIAIHLGLLAWLLLLLALPSLLRVQFQSDMRIGFGHTRLAAVFQSRLFDELGAQGWKYLFVPAVYGFVFGHVCGLLFRKLVVACGVAAMLGGVAAAGWGPSLLAGGVKHWQVWTPALVVLLTGRLLIRAWAADRILGRGPVLRLVGAGVIVLTVFAAGLTYRMIEIPDDPTGRDDVAFVAALPQPAVDGGQQFRSAADRLARTFVVASQTPVRATDPRRRPFADRLEIVIRGGWIGDDPELIAWLNQLYVEPPPDPNGATEPWWRAAENAAKEPITVYEPPALVNTMESTATTLDNGRKMSLVILTRGLQLSAAGEPAAFVSAFKTTIALARNMRNGGGHLALGVAIEVERLALTAAEGWLAGLIGGLDGFQGLLDVIHVAPGGRHIARVVDSDMSRLARTVIAGLASEVARAASEADQSDPFDPRPHLLVDRHYIRGVTQAPNRWLTAILDTRRDPERAAAEADLVALAWAVPWERERSRRLVGLAPAVYPGRDLNPLVFGRPGGALLARARTAVDSTDAEIGLRVQRRVTILKAALSAYQGRHGRAPAAQAELISPDLLTRLPEDPYAEGRPFGYRVSVGESLVGRGRAAGGQLSAPGAAEVPFVVTVRAGQVVVWSVGPDRVDQGGKVPPGGPRAEDLVSLMPAF